MQNSTYSSSSSSATCVMQRVLPREASLEKSVVVISNNQDMFFDLAKERFQQLLKIKKKYIRILIEYVLDIKFHNYYDFDRFLREEIIMKFIKDNTYEVRLKKNNQFLFTDVEDQITKVKPQKNVFNTNELTFKLSCEFNLKENK